MKRPGATKQARLYRAEFLAARYSRFPFKFDPANYHASWLSVARDEEKVVQPAIVAALRARGAFAEIIDSGARTLRGRAYGAFRRAGLNPGAIMKGQTGAARAGTCDVIGCTDEGIFIAIEAKRPALIVDGRIVEPAGEVTVAQLEWLDRASRKGAIVGVAWGPTDVARIWPNEEEQP